MIRSPEVQRKHDAALPFLLPIRFRACLAGAIFSGTVSLSAWAAAGREDEIYFQDIPAVYGASKYEQSVSEAPASVSIITAAEIRQYGHRTLADVLRSVRGFYTTYDRNYTYVGVRGFGAPGDYTTRILLLLDGHRINDDVYSGSYYGSEFVLDVDLIDRVEVIRGPGSSLYGTGAFFAVVNVISKRGRDLHGVQVAASVGSLDTRKARTSYGTRFDSGLEVLASASTYESQGRRRAYYPEFDSPATNFGIAENSDSDRAKNFFTSVSLRGLSLRAGYVAREKTVPTAHFDTVFNDARSRTLDTHELLDLRYEHDFGDGSDLTARLYQDRYYYHAGLPLGDPVVVNQDFGDGRWWGTELKYTTRLGRYHKATLGWEYVDNYRQDQYNYDLDPFVSYLDLRKRSRSRAYYLLDEIRLRENLTLSAGVRYDSFYERGGTTNPRLALIYSPAQATTLKLLYGTAFRAPNAYESYYGEADAVGFRTNPDLKPDRIRTAEAVVEHYLADGLRAVGSVYRYRIDDLITLQTDPVDGMLVYRNLGRIDAKGVELELDGKLTRRLEGRISFSLQQSRDSISGAALTNSPRRLAKINLAGPLLADRLKAGLEVQYTSRRDTVKAIPVGGYTVTNLNLLSRDLHGLQLSFGVYNLFDRRYSDPASTEHFQYAIPQDGRTFRLKAEYTF